MIKFACIIKSDKDNEKKTDNGRYVDGDDGLPDINRLFRL